MATDNGSPPKGGSQEDWTAYLNHKKEWAAMLRQRYGDELKNSPPIPPWKKYPEYEPGSLFWRMGIGEGYLTDYIDVYFEHSSQAEINAYKLKYPEQPDWAGWYKDR